MDDIRRETDPRQAARRIGYMLGTIERACFDRPIAAAALAEALAEGRKEGLQNGPASERVILDDLPLAFQSTLLMHAWQELMHEEDWDIYPRAFRIACLDEAIAAANSLDCGMGSGAYNEARDVVNKRFGELLREHGLEDEGLADSITL